MKNVLSIVCLCFFNLVSSQWATASVDWQSVDGGLVQVSAGDTHAWGVNSRDEIYRRPVDGSGQWQRMPGLLINVSASGKGWIWGVNRNHDIWKCAKPCDSGAWQNVPGKLVQVSADDTRVWGVNSRAEIYRRPVDGSGQWQRMPGLLINVSASGKGWIWGVNRANSIWKCAKPCDSGAWQQVDGRLAQVSADGAEVWGIQKPGDSIWYRPVDGSGEWQRVPGALTQVSASGPRWIWGVNSAHAIYRAERASAVHTAPASTAAVTASEDSATVAAEAGWGDRSVALSCPATEAASIEVVEATYGANCGASGGNVTQHIAAQCNGQPTCNYVIDYRIIGDPAPGCAKDYGVRWRCEGSRGTTPVVATGDQSTSPGDVIAPVATAAVTAGNLALGKTVDTGPGKPVSMGTVCSLLQVASSQVDSVLEKRKQDEARDQLLSQWAEILYETQQETGVSIANIQTADLLNVMSRFESEQQEVETQPADLVSAGYLVNDPGGTLSVGATAIPVDGATNPLVIGKLIVFDGVPGSYKIKTHYLGGPGVITIEPGLKAVPADNGGLRTEPEWQSFDIARQVLDIAAIADPTGVTTVVSAYLHPVCGTEEADRSRGDICWRNSEGRGVGVIPIACNPALPDHDGGLCYQNCRPGYHGVGPVCWTDQQVSIPRGVGVLPASCPSTHPVQEAGLCYQRCSQGWRAIGTICYQDCPAGLRDDGLYCGKLSYGRGAGYPLGQEARCNADNADVGGCERWGLINYPKCKPGFTNVGCCICQSAGCPAGWEDIGVSCKKPSVGREVGIIPNVCASNTPDFQAGLCYQSCPQDYNGVGPVCWTNASISYGRGVGLVPDQCPPSHPNFDAGLCYQNCPNPDLAPVGPVCWGQCGGRYPADCGAGCATSDAACGMAIAEMVAAPFDMMFTIAATIGTFGGYTFIDSAKDSAKLAAKSAKQAAQAALKNAAEEGVEIAGKKMGKGIAKGIQKNIDSLVKLSARLADQKQLIKQSLKETVFDPAKDLLTRRAVKEAADKAGRDAMEEAVQKHGLKLVADFDVAIGGAEENVVKPIKAAAESAQTATEKRLKEAAEKALQESSAAAQHDQLSRATDLLANLDTVQRPPLTLKEIKDRFYQAAANVSEDFAGRTVAMARECAILGIQIDEQWAGY